MLILGSDGAPPRREPRLDRVRTRSQDRSNVFDFEATAGMFDFITGSGPHYCIIVCLTNRYAIISAPGQGGRLGPIVASETRGKSRRMGLSRESGGGRPCPALAHRLSGSTHMGREEAG